MTHLQLLLLAQELGYESIGGKGLCQGFSAMWIQAVCCGNVPAFNKRLEILEKYTSHSPKRLKVKIDTLREELRNKKRTWETLGPDDKALLEIPAFFEGIALYLKPEIGFELFGDKRLLQHNEVQISPYIQSEALEEKGGLSRAFTTTHQYSQETLANHLNKISWELLDKPKSAINFWANGHSVAVRVLANGRFQLIDTNQLDKAHRTYNSKELAKELDRAFVNNSWLNRLIDQKPLVLSTSIFTNKNDNDKEPLAIGALVNDKPLLTLASDKFGRTVLHVAAFMNDTKTLEQLIYFSHVNINWHLRKDGTTALIAACAAGSKDTARFLLSQNDIDPNKPEKTAKVTPLHSACYRGDVEIVEALLGHPKIDVNKANKNKVTPLHVACARGQREVVEKLLEHPNINCHIRTKEGLSPLLMACEYDHPELIPLLLEKNALSLSMDDLKPDSPVFESIKACNKNTQIAFLQQALQCYIANREQDSNYLNIWNAGFSKLDKVNAARALLNKLDDDNVDLTSHQEETLNDGRLAPLYRLYSQITQPLSYATILANLGLIEEKLKLLEAINSNFFQSITVPEQANEGMVEIQEFTEITAKQVLDDAQNIVMNTENEPVIQLN